MEEYYVYALIDPFNNEIFYIGKGKGNRINCHFKELKKYIQLLENGIPTRKGNFSNSNKTERMRLIQSKGLETKADKLIENISEKAAFVLEEILVERIGRKFLESGPLLNFSPGGDWKYPKIMLKESEKIQMETVKKDFPELITVINKIPNTAIESEAIKNFKKNPLMFD